MCGFPLEVKTPQAHGLPCSRRCSRPWEGSWISAPWRGHIEIKIDSYYGQMYVYTWRIINNYTHIHTYIHHIYTCIHMDKVVGRSSKSRRGKKTHVWSKVYPKRVLGLPCHKTWWSRSQSSDRDGSKPPELPDISVATGSQGCVWSIAAIATFVGTGWYWLFYMSCCI